MNYQKNKFKKLIQISIIASFAVVVSFLIAPSVAVAETPVCGSTITTSTTLDSDMSCPGTAIIIGADNIVLDCAGHNITGTGTGYGIYLSGRTGVTIKNCVVTKFSNGINFYSSSNNILTSNNANNNYSCGIWLDSSSYNTLTSNTASNNINNGIVLIYSSSNNILTSNTAYSNMYGFIVYFSSNNNILTDNTASSNGNGGFGFNSCSNNILTKNKESSSIYGIHLWYSSNNIFTNNTVSSNRERGISLDYNSNNNIITNNNVNNNNGYGIYLGSSSNNNIYNNLFNNTNNVYVDSSSNYWNTTKTSGTNIIGGCGIGGNAWFTPSGAGYSQTCTDTSPLDGICDSAYILATNNTDYLPLKAGVSGFTYYRDADGDGYGDALMTTQACSAPSGYVSDSTDCNDNDTAINPSATEVCNGVDDNCNGIVNEGFLDTDNDGTTDCIDLDDDNDGILDLADLCPLENAVGFDSNSDGCIDTIGGLQQTINTLPDGVLSDEIKNSLTSKVNNALKSLDKENDEAAINMLKAFVNQVEAQRGKKISGETADMLIQYANNVIARIKAE